MANGVKLECDKPGDFDLLESGFTHVVQSLSNLKRFDIDHERSDTDGADDAGAVVRTENCNRLIRYLKRGFPDLFKRLILASPMLQLAP